MVIQDTFPEEFIKLYWGKDKEKGLKIAKQIFSSFPDNRKIHNDLIPNGHKGFEIIDKKGKVILKVAINGKCQVSKRYAIDDNYIEDFIIIFGENEVRKGKCEKQLATFEDNDLENLINVIKKII